MKTAKLVFGIFSIVFSIIVLLQSCAASIADAIDNSGGYSGTAGTLVAILMLTAGIVNIVTRNSKGGAIACTILFAVAGFVGITMHGIFSDLQIWGIYCFIVAIINYFSIKNQFNTFQTLENNIDNPHTTSDKSLEAHGDDNSDEVSHQE